MSFVRGLKWTIALAALGMATAPTAYADFKVRAPIVDYREVEFEFNGAVTHDRDRTLNKDQSYTFELGAGITPWWLLELEAETNAPPGKPLHQTATTIENIFQLTPQGKYWADFGLFFEYSHAWRKGDADSAAFGPIVQKELPGPWGGSLHTINVFFGRELGRNGTNNTGLSIALQSRLRLDPLFEPGVEYYGSVADLGSLGRSQQQRAGPVVVGFLNLAPVGKLRYELGYLVGLTRETERGAIRARLEYEIPF